MKNLFGARRGFTTIELMVVVSIIAILSAIVLTSMSGSRGKSRDAQRVSDLHQLQLALALFFDQCGVYPNVNTLTLTSGVTAPVTGGCPTGATGITMERFISKIPTPPGGGNYDYNYYMTPSRSANGRAVNYLLHTSLETTNAAVSKGLNAGSIYNASSVLSSSAPGWSTAANDGVWATCSGADGSTSYCIGPN